MGGEALQNKVLLLLLIEPALRYRFDNNYDVFDRELAVFVNVIEAFECAVNKVLEDEESPNQKWKVDGSGNFNALVRLCIRHVKSFCVRYLCGSNNLTFSEQKFDQRPMECKDKAQQRWSKLRSKLRNYMIVLVKVRSFPCISNNYRKKIIF